MSYVNRILDEMSYVYRLDTHPHDFRKSLKTFWHTKDWGTSGGIGTKPPKDVGKVRTTKGLYAGRKRDTAIYAGGGSVGVTSRKTGAKRDVYFNPKDKPKLKTGAGVVSKFPASRFKRVGSGEYFSRRPGKPTSQTTIYPLQYLRRQGYRVHFGKPPRGSS